MAELKSTIVKGNLRVTDDADIKNIKENGTALSDKYLSKTAKASDADKLDGNDSSYYLNYNNLNNKPTIPTVDYPVTDVKVNNASVVSNKVANIVTNSTYNASTNKIATMSDLPDTSDFIQKSSTSGLVKNDGTIDTTTYSTFSGSYNDLSNKPTIPTKTSDLTNDEFIRYDTASQGLNATQKSNARTNIGAGTSNLAIGTTSTDAAAGNHTHALSMTIKSGTATQNLIPGGHYQLSAGGSLIDFNMPTAQGKSNLMYATNTFSDNIAYVNMNPYPATTATSTWVSNDDNAGKLYLGTVNPVKESRLNLNGYLYSSKVYSGGELVTTNSSSKWNEYYLASNPNGYTSNTGTVTSVRVQAGTGLSSSTSTAQTSTLNTTISVASGYKLPTTTEWNENLAINYSTDVGYSITAPSTSTKVVTLSNFTRTTGKRFIVYLARTSSVANATFNVNSTGSTSIRLNGSATTSSNFTFGYYDCYYDGTYYQIKKINGGIPMKWHYDLLTSGTNLNQLSVTFDANVPVLYSKSLLLETISNNTTQSYANVLQNYPRISISNDSTITFSNVELFYYSRSYWDDDEDSYQGDWKSKILLIRGTDDTWGSPIFIFINDNGSVSSIRSISGSFTYTISTGTSTGNIIGKPVM